MIPPKLKGKEFEAWIIKRANRLRDVGYWRFQRYGVKSTFLEGQWKPIDSNPDFEGTVTELGGRHLIIEAKAVSGASFPIGASDHFSDNQLKVLYEERKANGLSCILVHYNRRELKTKTVEQATICIPVTERLYSEVSEGRLKSLNIENAVLDYGAIPVPWNLWSERCRVYEPDLKYLVEKLSYAQRP